MLLELTFCSERNQTAVSPPRFSLVKWYMDCVTEQGEAAILYCAALRWRGIPLTYSSVLSTCGQAATTRSSMGRYRLSWTEKEVVVELPRLRVLGRWEAAAAPFEQTVYASPAGSVVWSCVQPRSSARVTVGERVLSGPGYAERLTVTLPPWQLPMRQLRWGRFVSPQDTLSWIDWQGPYSTSFAVHNGVRREIVSVSESEVALSNSVLRLEESLPLRAGRLGSTVLPGAPALRKLLPGSLANIEERKWRSRGTLEIDDRQSRGWVIHEVVDWNL